MSNPFFTEEMFYAFFAVITGAIFVVLQLFVGVSSFVFGFEYHWYYTLIIAVVSVALFVAWLFFGAYF